jgi:hypothetical protein
MLSKVHREIGRYKERLTGKPVDERFGDKEVRRLRDKYNLYTLSELNVNERYQILDAIDYFEEWCASYS